MNKLIFLVFGAGGLLVVLTQVPDDIVAAHRVMFAGGWTYLLSVLFMAYSE